jgi:hypothetical protein
MSPQVFSKRDNRGTFDTSSIGTRKIVS